MKNTTIKKFLTSSFVVLFFVICLFVLKYIRSEADHSNSLGTIGNYTITSDEILMYANKNKTAVGEKFAKENDIDSYGSSFWTNDYNGKTPIDPLSAAIQSDLIYASTLHSEAKSYGIEVTDDFSSIKSNWESIKKKEGTNLSLYDYINNQLSNESDELKEKVYDEKPPTETELKEAFDSLDDAYKREDFKLSGIEVKFPVDQLESINNSLNELSTQHNDDSIVEQLGTLYPNSIFKTFLINSQETQKEDLYTLSTSEILFNKNTNELIEGSQEEQWFYITNKEGGNILSYKDAPNLGKNKYINDLFSHHMSEATNKNNVDLSQSITKVLMDNKEDIF